MAIVNTKATDWHTPILKPQVEAASSDIKVDSLTSAVRQSVPKHWIPIVFATYEGLPPVISAVSGTEFESSNQHVNGWLSLIREELYSISSVEDVFVSIEDTDVDLWVVIPERDLAILHQITEKEIDLFKTLVSGESPPFLIDFHIIYRCGRNIEDLAPTRSIRLPRQVQ